MPRPREPGFNQRQAAQFRKEFRRLCEAFGATNAIVGDGIDVLDAHGETGSAKAAGTKEVANAMMIARRLTHRGARRLVVALFISKRARALDLEYAAKGLGELVGLLAKFGAVHLSRSAHLPIFVSQDKAAELAERLSVEALTVPGVTKQNRADLACALRLYLRDNGPAMARAWCDAAQQPDVLHAARLSFAEAERVTESLTKAVFREAYVYQGEAPPWGTEFDVLARERPELVIFLEIPV